MSDDAHTHSSPDIAVACAKFVMWAMMDGSWEGADIDGGAAQDKAQALGLIVETVYDPEKHGKSDCCDPGDTWYEPSEKLVALLGTPQPPSVAQGAVPCGEPVAWHWRYVGEAEWRTPSGGRKLTKANLAYETPIEQRPLYASPAPSSWQPTDNELIVWARNWHWNDTAEDRPVDPSIYFRDIRMLKAFVERCRTSPVPSTDRGGK